MPTDPQSTFTKEIADEICELTAAGTSLADIGRMGGFPNPTTVWRWMRDPAEDTQAFKAAFYEARLMGTHALAAQCLEIADTPLIGEEREVTEGGEDGTITKIKTADMIHHRKLQVDVRMRLMGHWNKRDYGPKAEIEVKEPLRVVFDSGDSQL